VAGVTGLLDARCSILARLPGFDKHERRGTIMLGVNDRSSVLQSTSATDASSCQLPPPSFNHHHHYLVM